LSSLATIDNHNSCSLATIDNHNSSSLATINNHYSTSLATIDNHNSYASTWDSQPNRYTYQRLSAKPLCWSETRCKTFMPT